MIKRIANPPTSVTAVMQKLRLANNGYLIKKHLTANERNKIQRLVKAGKAIETSTHLYLPEALKAIKGEAA